MSLISIGMPLYNTEKFVREALDCLQRQTYKNIEIIVSDNCSTDQTLQIVEDYAKSDERIKIFRQPENIGPIPNFQFVVHQAKGEFFMWRSYDDWSDDTYIETLSSLLQSNGDIDLAVAEVVRWNGETEKIGGRHIGPHEKGTTLTTSRQMLKAAHPGWMYGLFRRQAARDAIDNVRQNFPHVWGWDHLVMFPFASQNRVGARYDTRFFQRETGISSDRYRPKMPREQVRLAWDFYKFCTSTVAQSNTGFFYKAVMSLYLLRYTSSCTEKFTRILRIALHLRRP